MLSLYCNTEQTDWCTYLPFVTFAYNTAKQETTRFSPFQLIFARNPTLPLDATLLETEDEPNTNELREKALLLRAIAVENIHKKQEKDKDIYDKYHRDGEFEVGDRVKIFIPIRKVGKSEKLLLQWFGPYRIIKKLSEVNYEVKQKKGKKNGYSAHREDFTIL